MKTFDAVAGVVLSLGLLAATPSCASTFGDNLSKCLVDKTTEHDKTGLIQWVFAAISAGPAVQSMTTVTPAQRTVYNRNAAQLINRLLTVDCRAQSVEAIKFDGLAAIEASFGVLGKVAMQGMMANPLVGVQLEQLGTFMDEKALKGLFSEAGVPAPPASPAK